ncbi:MAG: hypothetical protein ACOYM5_04195 [Caulobacter sp.]
MKPPSDNKGAANPYARRTPWGRVQAQPFKLGAGPGAAPLSGEPAAPKPPPMRQPRGGDLPGPGEGILGGSPLMPARAAGPVSPLNQPAEAKATPVRTPRSVPTPKSAPAPAVVAPTAALPRPPVTPPPPLAPSEIIERLAAIEAEPRPVDRRLLIGGVALGVIALIAVAALMLSRPDDLDEGAPEAAAAPAAPAAATPSFQAAPLPTAPIYRATPPVGAPGPRPAPGAAPPPVTTEPVPTLPPPVLTEPAPVVIPPVVEAPPPKPAPPPAPPRAAPDPDAPMVLRRGED